MAMRRIQSRPPNAQHLCHANMPNVRIGQLIDNWRMIARTNAAPGRQVPGPGKPEMSDDPSIPATERKSLTPAALRALAEAEERRRAAEANAKSAAKEFQGPKGPEPTRYGDWENKGIASDF